MTLEVFIDWSRDNDFSDPIDDISADVIEARWFLGMKKPYQAVADESTLSLTLDNSTGKYNPENSSSPIVTGGGSLVPNRRVQIEVNNVVMWTGWIERLDPDYQTAGAQTGKTTALIQCTGVKRFMDALTVDLSLYSNVTGDEPITDITGQLPPPSVQGLWLLGTPGYSELGVNTYLASEGDYSDIETGITTFTTFGDSSTYNATQAIKDITEAERGRFFVSRAGKYVWWNRHHLLQVTTVTATVNETGTYKPRTPLDYAYGQDIANVIRVNISPRKNATSTTLWELQDNISIPAGETIEFEAVYRDTDGKYVGGSSVSASGATFSSGTATITVTSLGNRARLSMANSGSSAAILTALTLVGTAKQDRNQAAVVAMDNDSIEEYGRKEFALNLKALTTYDQGRDVAQFELNRRKDPRGIIRSIEFLNKDNGTDNAHQTAWGMGTRLTVTLASNGHNADHFIIGEEHAWRVGGTHQTRFYLEPASVNEFWVLGVSTLGEDTYLAY